MNAARHFKQLALAAVLLFAGLTGYTLNALLDLQDELSRDLGENMIWATLQAMHQNSLVYQAQLGAQGASSHHNNQALQQALLQGRLQVLMAPTEEAFMRRAGVFEQLQQVRQLLAQKPTDYSRIQLLLHNIGRTIMQAERELAGARRDAYQKLMHQLIAFVAATMAWGALLCWQLLNSLKRTHQAHAQIARQHAQAQELLGALQRERAARERYRDFISLMSHQLRTPLAVIDSSAQRLLREGAADESQRAARSQRIRRSVRELNQLIGRALQGLRVFEQEQHPREQLHYQPSDWAEVIERALDRFDEQLAGRPLQLSWGEALPPLMLECDHQWCVEILVNLLSNADKFSPPGAPIRIHSEIENGQLLCRVSDSGPGLSEQELQKLFQRFYQGRQGLLHRGSGLGLNIAQTLARWQQGDLQASNGAAGGACFELRLPLKRPFSRPDTDP